VLVGPSHEGKEDIEEPHGRAIQGPAGRRSSSFERAAAMAPAALRPGLCQTPGAIEYHSPALSTFFHLKQTTYPPTQAKPRHPPATLESADDSYVRRRFSPIRPRPPKALAVRFCPAGSPLSSFRERNRPLFPAISVPWRSPLAAKTKRRTYNPLNDSFISTSSHTESITYRSHAPAARKTIRLVFAPKTPPKAILSNRFPAISSHYPSRRPPTHICVNVLIQGA
jgi:hypothetical protein